uniref:Uncharacterized protein n=1 Tax=Rhizophora mucronata TaxID=61149 RepID=A0A2P2QYR8_RHIMU
MFMFGVHYLEDAKYMVMHSWGKGWQSV